MKTFIFKFTTTKLGRVLTGIPYTVKRFNVVLSKENIKYYPARIVIIIR